MSLYKVKKTPNTGFGGPSLLLGSEHTRVCNQSACVSRGQVPPDTFGILQTISAKVVCWSQVSVLFNRRAPKWTCTR